ncbi:MAG: ROK family protein [Chlamydiia bacterium]|nr:ROK family protein [Chlamydiia bacterium]
MKCIAIDIGGTKVESALVKGDQIEKEHKEPVDKEHLVDQIIRLVNRFEDDVPIGIGMAGQIKEGVVISSPNLPVQNFAFAKEVEKQTGKKCALLNDVQAAALAESKFGAGKGSQRLLVVFLGTGIGGGIVIDGKLQTGGAGEIGHTVIVQDGLDCSCGRKGCVEPYASGWGLAKQAGVKEAKDVLKPGGNKIAEAGFKALVTMFANAANFLNPDKIVLGGNLLKGYEAAFPNFFEDLAHEVKKQLFIPNGEHLVFEKSRFPSTGVLIGAAANAQATKS